MVCSFTISVFICLLLLSWFIPPPFQFRYVLLLFSWFVSCFVAGCFPGDEFILFVFFISVVVVITVVFVVMAVWLGSRACFRWGFGFGRVCFVPWVEDCGLGVGTVLLVLVAVCWSQNPFRCCC